MQTNFISGDFLNGGINNFVFVKSILILNLTFISYFKVKHMKLKLTLVLTLFFACNLVAQELKPAPEGITAESVINDYINAIGGLAKLNKVNSISTWAKTEMQGQEIRITSHSARGNKFYQEIGTPDMTFQKQICNGQKAYIIAGGQRAEITGEAFENLKFEAELFREAKYKELGVSLELLGIEKVNDKEAYKIKCSLASGYEFVEYYDTETKYKVRTENQMKTQEGKVTIISDFGDYRNVKGVFYPYTLKQEIGPQLIDMVVTLIQINKAKASVFEVE